MQGLVLLLSCTRVSSSSGLVCWNRCDNITQGFGSCPVRSTWKAVAFFGKRVHEICPRNGYFQLGIFSKKFSDPYCMYQWVVRGLSPMRIVLCGCGIAAIAGVLVQIALHWLCGPGFPDKQSPFRKEAEDWEMVPMANATSRW